MALKKEGTEVVVDYGCGSDDDDDDDEDDEDDDDILYLRDTSAEESQPYGDIDREMRAADRLSIRLLAVEDNEEEENRLLRKSLRLSPVFLKRAARDHAAIEDIDEYDSNGDNIDHQILMERKLLDDINRSPRMSNKEGMRARKRVRMMIFGAITGLVLVISGIILVGHVTGPPYQPVGPYTLIERQTGDDFFQYYNFYDGADSVGSNGYNQYVNHEHAINRGILNVTEEVDDIYSEETRSFIYMGSAPTNAGPRDSIRLEGTRRFNRGLFM